MSRARVQKDGPAPHVAVRLELDIIARLDALKAGLSTEWMAASRSDVMRACILRGLPLVEAETKKTKRRGST